MFGMELWPFIPAVLVLSKLNRKSSQLPTATASVEIILRILKEDWKSQHHSPCLLNISVADTQENESPAHCFGVLHRKKQEQHLVTNPYYFSTDPAETQWNMAIWALNWEGLIMSKVTCESKFQGASLLADKPEYFDWESSCLYLRMFLFTFKCKLLYLAQSLCQVRELLKNKLSFGVDCLDQKNCVNHSVFLFNLCKKNI